MTPLMIVTKAGGVDRPELLARGIDVQKAMACANAPFSLLLLDAGGMSLTFHSSYDSAHKEAAKLLQSHDASAMYLQVGQHESLYVATVDGTSH